MHPKENPAAPVGSSSHRDDHCCNSAPAQPITSAAAAAAAVNGTGMAFHIATMDCAAEESEIRRALAPVPGLHGLSRSEEHTSELQSLMRNSYAVFCLKKKNNNNQ